MMRPKKTQPSQIFLEEAEAVPHCSICWDLKISVRDTLSNQYISRVHIRGMINTRFS